MPKIAGVDEAGRGPVLGPLVIAGVVLDSKDIGTLVKNGLKDSKLLSGKKRAELYELVLEHACEHQIILLTPQEIDENSKGEGNLNSLEIDTMINILATLKGWSKAYVDACDVNAERCQQKLQQALQTDVCAEHNADQKYPVVSAASILAKVVRDRAIQEEQANYQANLGSGYPSDPKTIAFLESYYKKFGKLPPIARKSWETCKKLIAACTQTSLEDFFQSTSQKTD